MRLTAFAESLQVPLREALAQLEGTIFARSSFDPQREHRTFTLSATDYTSFVLLSRLQAALAATRTQVRVRVVTSDVGGSIPRLEAGEIDLAILPAHFRQFPGLSSERLFDERFVPTVWAGNQAVPAPLPSEVLASPRLLNDRPRPARLRRSPGRTGPSCDRL